MNTLVIGQNHKKVSVETYVYWLIELLILSIILFHRAYPILTVFLRHLHPLFTFLYVANLIIINF